MEQNELQQTESSSQETSPMTHIIEKSGITSSRDSLFGRLFAGRINRRNYFIGGVIIASIILAVFFILSFCIAFFNLHTGYQPSLNAFGFTNINPQGGWFTIPYIIITAFLIGLFILINISLSIRRFHDLGYSGWFILFTFVPFIGNFLPLYLLFWPGKPEDNKYGKKPEPKLYILESLGLG